MRRFIKTYSTGLLLFGMMASLCLAQSQTDILEKMIEASGGRKLLGSVKDTTLTGTIEIVMSGMSGDIIFYQKEPNKMRMDMETIGMVFTNAYDGKTAWGTNPQTGNVEEMTGERAKSIEREAYNNDMLLNPDKYGVSFTRKESENIDGKDYFVLEQSFPDGFTVTWYIDSKTYLPHKTVAILIQMGVEVEAESFYSDWRKVDGMMQMFAISNFIDGVEAVSMNFTEVKFNTGLEDSFFEMEKINLPH